MAKYVREIMNPELFSVEPEAPRDDTLNFLLLLGISACPVIDEAGKLMGMVSVPDLMLEEGGGRTRDRMSEPAVTIHKDATVQEAGKKLSAFHAHRLIVMDDKSRAVGMVSAVDLVAALVGAPVAHPVGFPHVDPTGTVSWSNDKELEPEESEDVPNEKGILVLIYGEAGREEVPVWAEAVNNLRARVDDLVSGGPQDALNLNHILSADHGHLRFRTAVVEDAQARADMLAACQLRIRQRLNRPL